ncbi:MAG: phosphoglucosamine mutase, partial [Pseudomonadota bacterium]
GALALSLKSQGALQGDTLVSTVMSNLGLERKLEAEGIQLIRTQVGDRYVVEAMREGSFNLGGEQSGHIVLSDYSRTGDGLLAGLQVLKLLKDSGKKASEALRIFEPVPQLLRNVTFKNGSPLEETTVQDAIKQAEETLSNDGRVLVRASGTEPVIRVMAEGDDAAKIESVVSDICTAVEKASV